MFHQWLTLKEDAAAVIEDDPHGDDEEEPAEEELEAPDMLKLLNQILTHVHSISNLGLRLGDSRFQNSALKKCEHVTIQSTSMCVVFLNRTILSISKYFVYSLHQVQFLQFVL